MICANERGKVKGGEGGGEGSCLNRIEKARASVLTGTISTPIKIDDFSSRLTHVAPCEKTHTHTQQERSQAWAGVGLSSPKQKYSSPNEMKTISPFGLGLMFFC